MSATDVAAWWGGIVATLILAWDVYKWKKTRPTDDSFTEQVKRIALKPPEIPYVSNVTGTWITASEATDPAYWARHLRQTVRFADGVHTLLQEPGRTLLEVGPGQTLCSLVRQHPEKSSGQVVLPSLRHPQDKQSDLTLLLSTQGTQ